jgi:hypothetical protein
MKRERVRDLQRASERASERESDSNIGEVVQIRLRQCIDESSCKVMRVGRLGQCKVN